MSATPLQRPDRFTRCYGCGPDNERGLKLDFFKEGDSVIARFVPAPDHGGYGVIVHGGVTATLLDEAFGWTIFGLLGKLGMTTDMKIEFKAPLRCGKTATVRGRVERHDDREIFVRAEVHDDQGILAAVGTGTMRVVSMRVVERLGAFEKPQA